jgi:DNA binding domain, excisionase family
MDPLLIRPSEAAEATGLGRTKLYALLAAGIIPSVRIGRSVRIPVEALRNWLAGLARDEGKRNE